MADQLLALIVVLVGLLIVTPASVVARKRGWKLYKTLEIVLGFYIPLAVVVCIAVHYLT